MRKQLSRAKLRGSKKQKGKGTKRGGTARDLGLATTLTDKLIEDFCDLIREGLPFDACCEYLGISDTAYYNWRKKGEQYIRNDGEPEKFDKYARFVVATRKAFAQFKRDTIKRMRAEGNRLWVREMATLERRDRHNFSRYDPIGGMEDEYDPDERFI